MAEYIDREAAMNLCGDIPIWGDTAKMVIDSIPASDVSTVRHGKWHDMYLMPGGTMEQTCSCCQKRFTSIAPKTPFGIGGLKYCPNCGAKMDKEV